MHTGDPRDKTFASCAFVMYFVAVLVLLGGTWYLLDGLISGKWKDFLGRRWASGVSMALGLATVCIGLAYVFLAHGMKRRKPLAAWLAVVVGWSVFLALLLHVWQSGNGICGLILWVGMLVNVHLAVHSYHASNDAQGGR